MPDLQPATLDIVLATLRGIDAKLTDLQAFTASLSQRQAVTESRQTTHEESEQAKGIDLKDTIGEIRERLTGIESRLGEIERKGAVSLGRASVVGAVVGSVLTAVAEYVGTHGIPGLTH